MPGPSDPLVIGLDVGGSSTRAVVVSLTGEQIGSGVAGGGNPVSHGVEPAAAHLRAALGAALAGLDPDRVRAGVIGLAGAGRLRTDPAARAAYDRAWRDAGPRCPYEVHGDALVGYASATSSRDGSIVIAGTGAVAAQVRGLRLDRVADGHGWLLGDAGSGFWLGREAVRHTLAELDAYPAAPTAEPPEPGPLAVLVRTELLGSARMLHAPRETVGELIQAVTRRPAVDLAALAPLVFAADRDGDPAAHAIIASAAGHLVASVARIRPDAATTPIVLGGGLLTTHSGGPSVAPTGEPRATETGGPHTAYAGGPLANAVGELLAQRWPAAPLLTAGDGATGAAWLAARTLPEVVDPAELHRRLLRH